MGGRGSKSSYGSEGITTGDDGKKLPFYDLTDRFKGMTIQEFEKAVRDRKNEYIGLADDSGRIIIAGTSYNHGAVAVPTDHPDFKNVTDLTHNHPYHGGRELGGSFSGADVRNHVNLKLNSTRATSKEKTYIIRNKGATPAQSRRMSGIAEKSDNIWSREATTRRDKIKKNLSTKGKSMSSKTSNRIVYGYGTRLWNSIVNGRNSGYEYVEIKAKNRT